MIAFDTSALVKLVISEPESDPLEGWLAARPDLAWVASDLCRVEVVRAVARELEGEGVQASGAHFPGLRFGRLLPAEGRRRWVV